MNLRTKNLTKNSKHFLKHRISPSSEKQFGFFCLYISNFSHLSLYFLESYPLHVILHHPFSLCGPTKRVVFRTPCHDILIICKQLST